MMPILLFIFLASPRSEAQVVDKVKGSEAWISGIQDKNFKEGDTVNILDEGLSQVGSATIKKISSGQSSMIVALPAGAKVLVGMRVEKSADKYEATKDYSQLSEEERKILNIGEISTARYVIGGVLGTYPLGLGIGHAIQGRYSDKGWIFTVGELGSIVVMAAGLGSCTYSAYRDEGDCQNSGLIFAGLLGLVGFRIWEVVDVWATPPEHNRRYRELKSRVGLSDNFKWQGIAAMPVQDGLLLGTQFRF